MKQQLSNQQLPLSITIQTKIHQSPQKLQIHNATRQDIQYMLHKQKQHHHQNWKLSEHHITQLQVQKPDQQLFQSRVIVQDNQNLDKVVYKNQFLELSKSIDKKNYPISPVQLNKERQQQSIQNNKNLMSIINLPNLNQILITQQSQIQDNIEKIEKQEKQMEDQVKQLNKKIQRSKQQKKEFQQKKKKLLEKHKDIIKKLQLRDIEQQQKNSEQIKQQRKKNIQMYLKSVKVKQQFLQQLKSQRHSQVKNHQIPKYIEIQQKIKQQQMQKNEQLELFHKKHRENLITNFKEIKEHEKRYLQIIKSRSQSIKPRIQSNPFKPTADFNLNLYRKQDQLAKQKIKLQRRQQYKGRLKELEIAINPKRRLQSLVKEDKIHNPYKYHYLQRKGLNEFEIFENFKNFKIQLDAKKQGIQYLNQLRIKNQQLKLKQKIQNNQRVRQKNPSRSESETKLSKVSSNHNEVKSVKYINYLPTISNKKKYDDIQSIVHSKQNKQSKLQNLIQKSENLENQAIKKLGNLNKINQINNYEQYLKIQDNIDDLFIKSLKAKVACVKLI